MDIASAEIPKPQATSIGIAAISALAYVLCDLLHESAHAVTTLLPLGVKAVSISTIGLSTSGSSAIVALAGPVFNLVLGCALLFALAPKLHATWRYFAWLFGTVNFFNGTAYLLYSAILGTGDWATTFNAVAEPQLWRPVAGFFGIVLYIASIAVSFITLRRLCSSGITTTPSAERYCIISYWAGGIIVTVAAAFNPISPWFILTSGAAVGFGAMLGLFALPVLLRRNPPTVAFASESLHIGWPWITAGTIALVVFIGVFGPGLRLAS